MGRSVAALLLLCLLHSGKAADPAIIIESTTLEEPATGLATATITARLEEGADRDLSFSFSTRDGTAVAGEDYVSKSGTVMIPAGQTERQISIQLVGDQNLEADESFFIDTQALGNAFALPGFQSITGPVFQGQWGASFASDRQILAVADSTNSFDVTNGGAVYLYHKGPETVHWRYLPPIIPPTPENPINFGRSLAFARDQIIIGAELRSGVGIVYVYDLEQSDGSWQLAQRLTLADALFSEGFGGAISVDGETMAVACRRSRRVSFYSYDSTTNRWNLEYIFGDRVRVDFGNQPGITLRGTNLLTGYKIFTENPVGSRDWTARAVGTAQLALSPSGDVFAGLGSDFDELKIHYKVGDNWQSITKGNIGSQIRGIAISDADRVFVKSEIVGDIDSEEMFVFDRSGNNWIENGRFNLGRGHSSPDTIRVDSGNLMFYGSAFSVAVATPQSVPIVIHDSLVPNVSIADTEVGEPVDGESAAHFLVSLDRAVDSPVEIRYRSEDSDAIAGEDYMTSSGVLTIPAGETEGVIEVPVFADAVAEIEESFGVRLETTTPGTIERGFGQAAIIPPTPRLKVMDSSAWESDGTLNIDIEVSGVNFDPISVLFESGQGTAEHGGDFALPTGATILPAGAAGGSLSVLLVDDPIAEPTEKFELTTAQFSNVSVDSLWEIGETIATTDIDTAWGSRIHADQNTLLVGSTRGYSVSVYERSSENDPFEFVQLFTRPADSGRFGSEFDVCGDLMVISRPRSGAHGEAPGGVIVYRRNGNPEAPWNLVATIMDPRPRTTFARSGYGAAVAIDGTTLVVTSSTRVYIYRLSDPASETWLLEGEFRIFDLDPEFTTLGMYGYDCAIDQDTVVVVSRKDFYQPQDHGAVFFYQRTSATGKWKSAGVIRGDENVGVLRFAMDSGWAFVSDLTSDGSEGAVRVLRRNEQTDSYDEMGRLPHPDPGTAAGFGSNIAVEDGKLVVAGYDKLYFFGEDLAGHRQWDLVSSHALDERDSRWMVFAGADLAFRKYENPRGVDLFSIRTRLAEITLIDDDGPGVGIPAEVQMSESDPARSRVQIPVRLVIPHHETFTVDYTISSLSAAAGQDFRATAGTIEFSPGDMEEMILIEIIDDRINEEDERFRVDLTNPLTGKIANATTVITILNDDITAGEILIPEFTPAHYQVPSGPIPFPDWLQVAYDDDDWLTGSTGIGYGYSSSLQKTNVSSYMRYVNETILIRVPFDVRSVEPGWNQLRLSMKYEDGYVAYLNGTEISRRNAPDGVPEWNAGSTTFNLDSRAVIFEHTVIDLPPDLLIPGENILAIQGLNYMLSSTDMLILPKIDVGRRSGFDIWINGFAPLGGEAMAFGSDGEGDGLDNGFEYLLRRDPTVRDASYPFRLTYNKQGELVANVSLPAELPDDVVFELQGSPDLGSGNWESLGSVSRKEGWDSGLGLVSTLDGEIERTTIGPLVSPASDSYFIRGIVTTP